MPFFGPEIAENPRQCWFEQGSPFFDSKVVNSTPILRPFDVVAECGCVPAHWVRTQVRTLGRPHDCSHTSTGAAFRLPPSIAGVQTANPANLGLHPDAIEAPRSRPPYRILGRKDPSRTIMTHAKPANPAKAGLAAGFPACASSATAANLLVMRTIRTAVHWPKAPRHKAFRGIRTIRTHNNENTWRHHRHPTSRPMAPTTGQRLPRLPPARSMP